MKVGVDYYPEQCDKSCWPIDIDLMTEAGVSIVRLAEFAWSRIEPREGTFTVAWLDEILDMLHGAGIQAILGTPTATPPAWLHARYPEIYPADQRKYRLGFGTREQRCLNNPDMRAHSRRIVARLARHYANHPAVVGWQTDNELSGNLCYCSLCAEKFQAHLHEKYGTLEALNAAWGTSFWSQEYNEWSQVPLPWQVKCGDFHNPSLQMEFRRFQSQATVTFQREQIAILRSCAPRHFVTHNLMGLHSSMDYFEFARDLDFVSWDNYPITPWYTDRCGAALAADVMRGIKQRNVWVMEQQNGIAGWNTMGRRPSSQWLRCAAWQTVAHGADSVVFFRWRSACHGTEQYWHGVINHDGQPRRRYRELVDFVREMQDVSPLIDGTEPRSEVAILNSYDQHFAFDIQPQAEGLGVWNQVQRYYAALKKNGINVDVVPLTADLQRYKLVIAPSWYVLTDEDAERFNRYVQQGGTLVMSPRTGVKNGVNACHSEALPALLTKLAGVEVDDYDPLGADTSKICTVDGGEFPVSVWADALLVRDAEPVAHYADSIYPGECAVSKRRTGRGAVYYVGTFGNDAFYSYLLGKIMDEVHVAGRLDLPEGVDANWREGENGRYLFLLNFNNDEVTVTVGDGLTAVAGEPPQKGCVTLPACGVGIYGVALKEATDRLGTISYYRTSRQKEKGAKTCEKKVSR